MPKALRTSAGLYRSDAGALAAVDVDVVAAARVVEVDDPGHVDRPATRGGGEGAAVRRARRPGGGPRSGRPRLGCDLSWGRERPFQVRIDEVEEASQAAHGVPLVGLPDEERVGVRPSITIRQALRGSSGTIAISIRLRRAR